MNAIIYIIIFIMGTVFGSFLTLATYRLPLNEDIVKKHSYCPKCNHELSFWDMIPIFSYIILKGKCRYCKTKIGPRYLLIELICGASFVILALGLGINIYNLYTTKIVEFILGVLFIIFLFLIAKIDQEHHQIHRGVLIYGMIIATLNVIYHYVNDRAFNVNTIIIYLCIIAILVISSIIRLKKKSKDDYNFNIVIICIILNFFGGEILTIFTVIYTLLAIAITLLFNKILYKREKYNEKMPVAFYLCVVNSAVWIAMFLAQIGG